MHYFQVLLRLLQAPSVLAEEGSEMDASLTTLFGESPQQLVSHSKVCLETVTSLLPAARLRVARQLPHRLTDGHVFYSHQQHLHIPSR